jgi:hypothetical protein
MNVPADHRDGDMSQAGPVCFSSGLPADSEFCLMEPQPIPYFAENFWFTAYDD